MPVSVLPRPMRSRGRPKGLTDASEPGAAPASSGIAAQPADYRHEPAAAHYRRGEGDRLRGVQARPDGAVPRMPRGRSPGVGGTVGFPPQSDGGEKGPAPGFRPPLA